VDRLIIAGTPAQCKERIAELFSLAARDGFTQITLGVPLGPDIPEVIRLWGEEILPMLRYWRQRRAAARHANQILL